MLANSNRDLRCMFFAALLLSLLTLGYQSPIAAIEGQSTTADFQSAPLGFEQNLGQVPHDIDYLSRGAGYTLLLSGNKAEFAFKNLRESGPQVQVVAFTLLDASRESALRGSQAMDGYINYIQGDNPENWIDHVSLYSELMVDDVYNGIDLRYTNNGEQLQYDFILQPGADSDDIQLSFEGVTGARIAADGALVLDTEFGELSHRAPYIYQEIAGTRQTVEGRFAIRSSASSQPIVGFDLDEYNKEHTLVIDPVVEFSTYLGANLNDSGATIAVDGDNNIYVTGTTDLIIPNPNNPNNPNSTIQRTDAFVSKFSPDGQTLLFSSVIGGTDDEGNFNDEVESGDKGIAVDELGHVYITGTTQSEDFPLLNPVQSAHGGGSSDVYVVKLTLDGSAPIYSTYLGGEDDDEGRDIALTPDNGVIVVGETRSDEFPLANPLQDERDQQDDAFITELSATGDSILFSSYLGGNKSDGAKAVEVDSDNNVYIAGYTSSNQRFPHTDNAFSSGFQGGSDDGFVAKLGPDRTSFEFVLNLGGSKLDVIEDLALTSQNNILVAGTTASKTDFPTTAGVFQSDYGGGGRDGFLSLISSSGDSLLASAYFGGNQQDFAYGIAVAPNGSIWLVGETSSKTFPLVEPLQDDKENNADMFIARFSQDIGELLFSSYYGGNHQDQGSDVVIDAEGSTVIVGTTTSDKDFPVVNALQANLDGNSDAFLVKLASDNRPPEIVSAPILNALVGVQYSYLVEAEDPEGDALTYALLEAPTGMTVDTSGLIEWLPDVAGDYSVTVAVTDVANNQASQPFVIAVEFDQTPPIITVLLPEDGSRLNTNSVTILGDLNEEAELTVNGNPVAIAADFSFSHEVSLLEGVNNFSFSATDPSGNVGTLTYTLIFDSLAPTIVFTNPEDNSVTNTPAVTLEGTLSEIADLEINDESVAVDSSTLSFSLEQTLLEGPNVFTARATDAAGNVSEQELTVNLDTIAPQILSLIPNDGITTGDAELVVSGELSEIATLEVAGNSVNINADLTFSTTLTLLEGVNEIQLRATDLAGNITVETLSVTLDTTPLDVTLTSPQLQRITNQAQISISGVVSKFAELTLDGEPLIQEADFSFSAEVQLAEGLNSFVLVASDAGGDEQTLQIEITLDSSAPAAPDLSLITRSAPIDGEITVNGAPGAAEAGSLLTVLNPVNNTSEILVVKSDGSFMVKMEVEQNEAIELSSSDSAGNTSPTVILNVPTPANLTLQAIGDRIAEIGTTLNLVAVAYNLGDVPISYSIEPLPLPEGALFDNQTGEFRFQPTGSQAGTFDFTIIAQDERETDSEQITITVPDASAANATELRGRVVDGISLSEGNLVPVVGSEVSYLDAERNALISTTTDLNGEFLLSPIPPSATRLRIDGSTAQLAADGSSYGSYEQFDMPLQNVTNVIERPFGVPRIRPEDEVQVVPGESTVVVNSTMGAELVVPADSAVMPDGTPFVGKLSINEVPSGFAPGGVANEDEPPILFSIQPAEVQFTQAVSLQIPNTLGFPDGTQLALVANRLQANSDEVVPSAPPMAVSNQSLQSRVANSARASRIGSFRERNTTPEPNQLAIVSCNTVFVFPITIFGGNPYSDYLDFPRVVGAFVVVAAAEGCEGIQGGGYFGVQPVPTEVEPAQNDLKTCGGCTGPGQDKMPIGSTVSLNDGALSHEINLPVYRSLETDWEHSFVYHSNRAYPYSIIPVKGTLPETGLQPGQIRYSVAIEGAEVNRNTFLVPGGIPNPGPEPEDSFGPGFEVSQAIDTTSFDTGIYDYVSTILTEYPEVTRASTTDSYVGNVQVINERDSAFGAGWMLRGFYRLVLDELNPFTEHALLVSPEGGATSYEPVVLAEQGEVVNIPGEPVEILDVSTGEYISPPSDFSSLVRDPSTETFIHTAKNGAQMHFDSDGYMTQRVDRNGNTVTYTYDGERRLRTIIDPVGKVSTFTYGADGLLDSVTDPAQRTTSFEHDAAGNLLEVRFPDDSFVQHTYDSRNLVASKTDERGFSFQYEFDGFGKLESVTLPDGSVRSTSNQNSNAMAEDLTAPGTGVPDANRQASFTDARQHSTSTQLDANSRTVLYIDEIGRETVHVRDDDGNAVSTTRPNGSRIDRVFDSRGNILEHLEDFNSARTNFTYDDFSLVTSITNPNNHSVIIDRNPATGNPESIRNELGHTTQLEYDSRGLLERSISPNGLITEYEYFPDSALLMTQAEFPPAGSPGNTRITQFTYFPTGLLQTMTTADGVILSFTYDLRSRLETVTDNLGQSVAFGYDNVGNIESVETLNGDGSLAQQLMNDYDMRNRLIASEAPHGVEQSVVKFLPDANGNIEKIFDPNNSQLETTSTDNVFDDANRLEQSTDREGGITQFVYNFDDRIEQVTAPNGVVTQYSYDLLGRMTAEISQDRGTTTYEYDVANNLTEVTDARGVIITYLYDELERVTNKTFSVPAGHLLEPIGVAEDVVYSYDSCAFGVGRLCGRTDESGNYSYAYDGFGNLTQMTRNELGVNYITAYSYDNGDNIEAMTLPSGRVINYGRDAVRRMASVDTTVDGQTQNIVNNVEYRGDNQITSMTFGNGLMDVREYDLQGRLTEQNLGQGLSIIDQRLYDYDLNSNLIARSGTGDSRSYGYDLLDRLTNDDIGTTEIDYSYDANGNRLTRTGSGGVDEQLTYETDVSNLLLTRAIARAGQPLSEFQDLTIKEFGYNRANRLYQLIEDGVVTAEYTYNDDGLRTRKTIYDEFGTPSTTVYHYDQLGMLISETTDTGELIRDYVWSEGLFPLAQIDADQDTGVESVSFLHRDHLLTPRLATDVGQATVWQWEGQAFGEGDVDAFASVTVNLRFPGQYFDEETGQHYNWMRNYDPEVGRYTQSDPIGLLAGVNTFGYSGENPAIYIDSNGLDSYLVSRPLANEVAGAVASHNFIVTNAKFLGDPNANVISYGALESGNMGRVTEDTGGFSAGTSDTDYNAWVSLANPTTDASYRKINAPDAQVAMIANSVNEDLPYFAFPELTMNSVNSNSAAGAVAHHADGGFASIVGGRIEPGASVAYRVIFDTFCSLP